jgi:hypothetical protein
VVQPGGHDPNQRGFTIPNAELSLQGAVDPSFRGDSHIIFAIDKNGETVVELEEAYLTTLTLPADLQLRLGQFFTEFGRLNRQHPHQWDFVDQPLVNNRMFGADGLRAPGARLSWLAPTPFFLEVLSGIQNPRGETQTSFLANDAAFEGTFSGGTAPASLGGHPFVQEEVQSAADMIYLERVATSFEIGEESTLAAGISALFGPNASGRDGSTQIYGVDAFYKWKPTANDQGWPFVTLQTESLWRRYHADDFTGDADGDGTPDPFPDEIFRDHGMYAQALYGFDRPWVAGFRVDYVDGDGASTGGLGPLDRRVRFSPNLTYYPSEFSKIRLQANFDKVQELQDDNFFSLWLQFEILFGAHGAHKF